MTTTATPVAQLTRIERGEEAWRLADAAYAALLDLLEELEPEEWQTPTVCGTWTVADMVGHLIGAAESEASIVDGIRQQVMASIKRGAYGGSSLDAWTGRQVERHLALTPGQRLTRLREVAPKAVRGRAKLPRLVGRLPISLAADMAGSLPDGSPEQTTLGELNTVIYTRDTWLHRIDIARATGRDPRLDPTVDGRIVADVVVEWAGRHAQPFVATLTGPAGGRYQQGSGGPHLKMDAVDLCWVLSGRAEPDPTQPGSDLLRTRVLF